MVLHSNTTSLAHSTFNFTGNLVERSQDFCLFVGSDTLSPSELNWKVVIADNQISHSERKWLILHISLFPVEMSLPIFKVRLNDQISGEIQLERNTYSNISLAAAAMSD